MSTLFAFIGIATCVFVALCAVAYGVFWVLAKSMGMP